MNYEKLDDVNLEEVFDGRHGPVIFNVPFAAGNGTIKKGQIVSKDDAGACVPYVAGDDAVAYGVAICDVDTTREEAANVLIHGTAKRALILVGANPAVQSDIDALEKAGVFALY